MGKDNFGRDRWEARKALVRAAREVIQDSEAVPFCAAYSIPSETFRGLLVAVQRVEEIENRVQEIMRAY